MKMFDNKIALGALAVLTMSLSAYASEESNDNTKNDIEESIKMTEEGNASMGNPFADENYNSEEKSTNDNCDDSNMKDIEESIDMTKKGTLSMGNPLTDK